MPALKGNKGEWGEPYATVKMLADGKVPMAIADEALGCNGTSDVKIFEVETEMSKNSLKFERNESRRKIMVRLNGANIREIDLDRLQQGAKIMLEGLLHGKGSSFEITQAEAIMREMELTKLRADSSRKSDLRIKFCDPRTGYPATEGFSIKSFIKSPPTLMNASGATGFKYRLPEMTDEGMAKINSIVSKSKIRDRIIEAEKISRMIYVGPCNPTMEGNLEKIDTKMGIIVGEYAMPMYYRNGIYLCSDIVTMLEENNPLKYSADGAYRYKWMTLLRKTALGMMPSKNWSGHEEALGGFINIEKDGSLKVYSAHNNNAFGNYLLNSTRLDTPSTKKCPFGYVYKENGQYFMNLCLQIRFNQ